MLFDFSGDQYDYRDAVRAVLRQRGTSGALRAAWSEPIDTASGCWRELADLGLFGIQVVEQHGGSGATPADLTLPLEEVGYSAVPEPVAETALVAPLMISRWASTELAARVLPELAAGDLAVTLALGSTGLAPYARRAQAFLTEQDGELHLVPADRAHLVPLGTMDQSLGAASCTFELCDETRLSSDPAAAAHARALAAVAASITLVGLSQRMQDMTREYILERRQFGRVIGSFQALKHRLADVAVQVEAARGLAWFAGYQAAAEPDDVEIAARTAKAAASRAAHAASAAALQLHGGIGFTWEHDLHLWMQRAQALEVLHGSVEEHRSVIGSWLLEQRNAELVG